MKPRIIYTDWIKYPANGVMLFPFILLRKNLIGAAEVKKIINHETIHFQQALETLVIPFYIIYGINWLINLIKYPIYDAYYNIIFEKEAHSNEMNWDYIKNRKRYSWLP